MESVRIATWNLQRKKPTSPTGAAGVAHLQSLEADVLVLTEARQVFPRGNGHLVWSRQHWTNEDERKVVMWSRQPWTNVDDLGSPHIPEGRFIAATTETPVGPIDVIGVCIPWSGANVSCHHRNRSRWEDHVAFLELLPSVLALRGIRHPYVVAGDFNQRIQRPMKRGGRITEPMFRCFESMDMPTIGVSPGWEREENDHIATSGLACLGTQGWGNVIDGVTCSDHGGVLIDAAVA